ncbi:MAG: hypothetical protein A2Z15_07920 [Chloroflexi bacterium RBG_16_50_11]|nr:MAG: hypothetical protein A2Z15_07920 [Chloroflexi bacterium RBG_16_50_11]
MVQYFQNKGSLDSKRISLLISSKQMEINSTSNKDSSNLRSKMLCLVRSKACKRCGGDLSIECDVYGVYIECIQCGATWTKNDLKLTSFQKSEPKLKPIDTKPLVITAVKR